MEHPHGHHRKGKGMVVTELIAKEIELKKAKDELDYARRIGGFRYKQAKAHYEKLIRKR